MVPLTLSSASTAGTVLQTAGGGFDVTTDVLILVGIAAVTVLAVTWLLTRPRE